MGQGEKGLILTEEVQLYIKNETNTVCTFKIPRGATLLASNNQKIYCNQVIAEIKQDKNLIEEKDRKDLSTDASGEVFLQKTSETFEHLKIQTSNTQLLFKLQVKNNESL